MSSYIDLSHLIAEEVDQYGNLTDWGVLKIKQRTAAAKAQDTVRRRYHTEFDWVKPIAPSYSLEKELVDEARAESVRARKEQAGCLEVSHLRTLQELRQRIAAL